MHHTKLHLDSTGVESATVTQALAVSHEVSAYDVLPPQSLSPHSHSVDATANTAASIHITDTANECAGGFARAADVTLHSPPPLDSQHNVALTVSARDDSNSIVMMTQIRS
ncbi:unnamed protein product, partial [Iphiclides podalirius]